MIFRRGYAAVDEELAILNELYDESSRFTQVSTELIAATGKNLTLFGEASTSVSIISVSLRAIDNLLSLFRAAPGIGKIIQKLLDQVVSVVRRAIPPFQRVLRNLSRVGSALNATVIPAARDLITVNVVPLFTRVSPIVTDLQITLAVLEPQQKLIEALLPPPILRMLSRRVGEIEELVRRSRSLLRALKAVNDLLESRRKFLDRIYGLLSAKKVVLDTVKAYLDEIASAIGGVLRAIGSAVPDVVKNFITALLDYVDTFIDWVLEQLQDLLAWIGIDISGPLAWIQSARDKLGQKLADMLSFLGELENLVQPLQELRDYLQSEVVARINEATETLRKLEEKCRQLLALLNGLGAWKELLEGKIPAWIEWLGRQLRELDTSGTKSAGVMRRELDRISAESWRLAAIPAQDFILLGDWNRLVSRTRSLLANRGLLRNPERRRQAVQEIEDGRRRLEAAWQARYGKAVARFPKGYVASLRASSPEAPLGRAGKTSGIARRRTPPARFEGSAESLKAFLPKRRQPRRPSSAIRRYQRKLEAELERIIHPA